MNYTREFIYPYLDELKEVALEKMEEILAEMNNVIERRQQLLKVIRTVKMREGENEMRDYFWTNLAELEFNRYAVLRKELVKWIRLYELTGEEKPKELTAEHLDAKMLSRDEIERARRRPIEEFYQDELRGTSRLTGRCPFHKEKTPSFVIYTDSNTFHCFGCQANGDAIDFVQRLRNVSFREAVEALL